MHTDDLTAQPIRRLPRLHARGGFVFLLWAYLLVSLLLVVTGTLITLGGNDLRVAERTARQSQLFWAAEAGVDRAVADLITSLPPTLQANQCTNTTTFAVQQLGSSSALPSVGVEGGTSGTQGVQASYRLCRQTSPSEAASPLSCMDLDSNGFCDSNAPDELVYRIEATATGPDGTSVALNPIVAWNSGLMQFPFSVYASDSVILANGSQTGSVLNGTATPSSSFGDVATGATELGPGNTARIQVNNGSELNGDAWIGGGNPHQMVSVDSSSALSGHVRVLSAIPVLPQIAVPSVTFTTAAVIVGGLTTVAGSLGGGIQPDSVVGLPLINTDTGALPPTACLAGGPSTAPVPYVIPQIVLSASGYTLCTNGHVTLYVTGEGITTGNSLVVDPGSRIYGQLQGPSNGLPRDALCSECLTIYVTGAGAVRLGKDTPTAATVAGSGLDAIVAARVYVAPSDPHQVALVYLQNHLKLFGGLNIRGRVYATSNTALYLDRSTDRRGVRVRPAEAFVRLWAVQPSSSTSGNGGGGKKN